LLVLLNQLVVAGSALAVSLDESGLMSLSMGISSSFRSGCQDRIGGGGMQVVVKSKITGFAVPTGPVVSCWVLLVVLSAPVAGRHFGVRFGVAVIIVRHVIVSK